MSYNYIGGISNKPKQRQNTLFPWIWWDDAFTNEELDRICELSLDRLEDSTVFVPDVDENNNIRGPQKPELVEDIRVSKNSFNYVREENAWIFERINSVINHINANFYNFDLNGYEMYQYAEYDSAKKGHYDFHMDMQMTEPLVFEMRKLSMTLMLNDPGVDFEGGDFQFMRSVPDKLETIELKKGRLILFPSFLVHRVTPVTKGIRKSLVVWVTGPKFR
jgi:PKHD-type hydroxylase